MNNPHAFFRRAFFLLIALAWTSIAFCDEIHDAAANGDLEKVRALLKNNPDLVFSKDDNGRTPLLYAAFKDHKDVVALLLANQADVNAVDKNGQTPLLYAAFKDYKDVVALLLANQADVNARDKNGQTPLHYAAFNGYEDVTKLLLAANADVNATDNSGQTPLLYAVANDQEGVAELLRHPPMGATRFIMSHYILLLGTIIVTVIIGFLYFRSKSASRVLGAS